MSHTALQRMATRRRGLGLLSLTMAPPALPTRRSSIPGSPSSLQSAPMDESDSDDEAPQGRTREDDENKYPVDGLFMSLAEKAEIMNMREVEREQILAERAQEKDRIHQNKLLRQLVSNEEQRNKKRSASAADLEENQRKTSRVRTKIGGTKVGETNSAIDTLKSRRAEKSERNRRREEDRERRKDRSPSFRNDLDGDAESEVEWAPMSKSKQHKSRSPEEDVLPVADLSDYERIRLSRSRFGQVCFYPGFEAAITGCYVRISIGPDPETGKPVYRMAVTKGKFNHTYARARTHRHTHTHTHREREREREEEAYLISRIYHRPAVCHLWRLGSTAGDGPVLPGCARQGAEGVALHRLFGRSLHRGMHVAAAEDRRTVVDAELCC